MTTTAETLQALADVYTLRAKDHEEDALLHQQNGRSDLYAYAEGLATGYRGAARTVRFQIAQLED